MTPWQWLVLLPICYCFYFVADYGQQCCDPGSSSSFSPSAGQCTSGLSCHLSGHHCPASYGQWGHSTAGPEGTTEADAEQDHCSASTDLTVAATAAAGPAATTLNVNSSGIYSFISLKKDLISNIATWLDERLDLSVKSCLIYCRRD